MRLRTLKTCMMLTCLVTIAHAQSNLTISPEHPKAGDLITITYEPGGDIANTLSPVEAIAYQLGDAGQKAIDIPLTRANKKLTGSFQTDAAANFVYFSFAANKKFDNNFNNGYTIQLMDGDKVKKGANQSLAYFYQYYAPGVGMDRDSKKSIASFEKEFEMYPESKKTGLSNYLRIMFAENKDAASAVAQKEIELQLKTGLNDENDYARIEDLYSTAKLPQQAKLIGNLKKEKYPNGKWTLNEQVNKFYNETDLAKKQQLLDDLVARSKTDTSWTTAKTSIGFYYQQMASEYAAAKQWDKYKETVAAANITDKVQLASLYNNIAWDMQKDSTNLPMAEEMSRFAVETATAELKSPTTPKPDYLTNKQWEQSRKNSLAMASDTYGMILYRMGKYKKGLPYAKTSALDIAGGKDADENTTYALLAEKALPRKDYKKQLEGFVKDGKASTAVRDILMRVYVKENKSEKGFDEYIGALQKESYMKMMDELNKSMLNEAAPSFALYNLDGNKIDISDLKGKVVVVDFWATWCGPCKASFPGMQKAVAKYKDDPSVKFIFVNTWERTDDKKKNAADFIEKNKYTFDVLLDNDDKVVAQFKVDGIPTKFVIGKDGKLRFKAVGFDGNDDKLVQELTAMIEMAANPEKKAF